MSEQTSNDLKQQDDTAHDAAVEYWDRSVEFMNGLGITAIFEGPHKEYDSDTKAAIARFTVAVITDIDSRECEGLLYRDRLAWGWRFMQAIRREWTRRVQEREAMALLARHCREILEGVAKGWAKPRPTWGYGWDSGHCGDIAYEVNGWKIVVFWDCGDWDYIDSVIAPDGRKAGFEDFTVKPDDMLNREGPKLCDLMVKAFERAQPEPTGTATDARPQF